MTESACDSVSGPLAGYRALELGNFIAAPYASRLFADFGGEVIKIERPRTGDELRRWRLPRGSTSLLWRTLGRNKKSVTLDLRSSPGRDLALELVRRSDVVFENFRPGTLEKWGLGFETLRRINPNVVLVRISGYGQTGPNRDLPGFGGVAEAYGGLRHLTGYPDRPPTRVGASLGDSLAGTFGLIGALMCLLRRERDGRGGDGGHGGGTGQVVDVALYESVFAVLDSLVPDYEGYGTVRQRTGNGLTGVAPSNIYPCRDGKWIVIGANADAVFRRMMTTIGRDDLAEDPRFADNVGRAEHEAMLDEVIADWTRERSLTEVAKALNEAGVPVGPIYDAADIAADEHYRARGMLQPHEVEISPGERRTLHFPGVVPKLSHTPGAVRWLGPEVGAHNDEVYQGLLNLSAERLEEYRRECII